jgi:hypothetical protein
VSRPAPTGPRLSRSSLAPAGFLFGILPPNRGAMRLDSMTKPSRCSCEMTSPEVEAFLEKQQTAIIPVGATEQHGLHGPLATDVLPFMHLGRLRTHMDRARHHRTGNASGIRLRCSLTEALPAGPIFSFQDCPERFLTERVLRLLCLACEAAILRPV